MSGYQQGYSLPGETFPFLGQKVTPHTRDFVYELA